jgi:hypothetical protein
MPTQGGGLYDALVLYGSGDSHRHDPQSVRIAPEQVTSGTTKLPEDRPGGPTGVPFDVHDVNCSIQWGQCQPPVVMANVHHHRERSIRVCLQDCRRATPAGNRGAAFCDQSHIAQLSGDLGCRAATEAKVASGSGTRQALMTAYKTQ